MALPLCVQAKSVSDRLVVDLSCSKITAQSIYDSIRSEAFSSHLNISNWSTGVIANCWSLSRTQRIHFYLHRDELLTQKNATGNAEAILNVIRGSIPDLVTQPLLQPKQVERKLAGLSVYQWSFDMGSLTAETKTSSGSFLQRSFVRDIEAYQARRFHDPSNLKKYVLSGANSSIENLKTVRKLIANLDQKKLTLINLRATRFAQHVVVVKSYELFEGGVDFTVYDSNDPVRKDSTLTFLKEVGIFISPMVMGPFLRQSGKPMDHFIDAFIVDEEDRSLIEKALVKYYKSTCEPLNE